jgi:hypothetical protein
MNFKSYPQQPRQMWGLDPVYSSYRYLYIYIIFNIYYMSLFISIIYHYSNILYIIIQIYYISFTIYLSVNIYLYQYLSYYRKMFIFNIHNNVITSSKNHSLEFHYYHRAIFKVEVVGIVTSICFPKKSMSICLDDGTSVINCNLYIENEDTDRPFQSLKFGDLVSIKGIYLSSFLYICF